MSEGPVTEALAIRSEEMLRHIAFLNNVPLRVEIEVGHITLRLSELMRLKPGVILEGRKIAGEPLDIRLNGRFVARGEVVSVDSSAGVRIVEVAKPGATQ